MGFYIGLQPQSGMMIGSEGILTVESATLPVQIVCGEEAHKDHDQSGCMYLQEKGNQVGYECL